MFNKGEKRRIGRYRFRTKRAQAITSGVELDGDEGNQKASRSKKKYTPPPPTLVNLNNNNTKSKYDNDDTNWIPGESHSALSSSSSSTGGEEDTVDRAESRDISAIDSGDISTVNSGELSVLSPHQYPPSMQRRFEARSNLTDTTNEDDESTYRDIERVTSSGTEGVFRDYNLSWAEAEYWGTKQQIAVFCIAFSAAQLAVLMLQLALCGVAPLDVNPTVGPYPDAFSDWQGKNAYLFVKDMQIWRIITPAFLHVGILHLLCNAVVTLEACAHFEREWGSWRWLLIYIVSEAGCVIMSCTVEPDTVAVGSSGALMGLFGAKLAQVMSFSAFDVEDEKDDHNFNTSQMVGTVCMFTLVAVMCAFSYIEWSGHVGGLIAGFFAGFVLLCGSVRSSCARVFLFTFGLGFLCMGFYFATTWLFTEVEPDEELADSCTYFRTLFAEGYDCECLWD